MLLLCVAWHLRLTAQNVAAGPPYVDSRCSWRNSRIRLRTSSAAGRSPSFMIIANHFLRLPSFFWPRPATAASPAVRFGRGVSYRARALRQGPFPATLHVFSATDPPADAGLWPMENSSPQTSHLRVPISWNPTAFSRPLFIYRHSPHLCPSWVRILIRPPGSTLRTSDRSI
jgi:hypothetical protein